MGAKYACGECGSSLVREYADGCKRGAELAGKMDDHFSGARSVPELERIVSQQREALMAALVFVEGVIRKRYTQYTGDDAVEYLRERGTLVIDENMKERPAIVLWKRLNAAIMARGVETHPAIKSDCFRHGAFDGVFCPTCEREGGR